MSNATTAKKMKLAVLTSGGDSAGINAVVRAVVKTAIIKYDRFLLVICAVFLTQRPFHRGCETWIVREGYEGLVRGNDGGHHHRSPHNLGAEKSANGSRSRTPTPEVVETESFTQTLRYGDGDLLRDGTGDHPSGRSLKGRYIVRVGWDDVRGWFSEVSPSSRIVSTILAQEQVVVRRVER